MIIIYDARQQPKTVKTATVQASESGVHHTSFTRVKARTERRN